MKNRFIRRGLLLLIAGIAFNVVGYIMKDHKMDYYGWLMIAGVIMFGIGFVSIFYSFFRKVEAQGIIEDRAEEKEKKAKFKIESKKRKHVLHT
ncbi:signal peptidase [Desertivirga xinjiangensis]|uniref:signal peptidase n=1 Tax=Desertivirga xinjiangensis TaxID=539206 RepID=UPI00210E7EC9|nr:signal peptidase [Pedobacter xinjiangensis]